MRHAPNALAIALIAALWTPLAFTATVYKSVDEYGRVTFSDQPPETAATVEVLEYRVPEISRSALDTARLEAMRETTDRMAADRREREIARARARERAAASRDARTQLGAYRNQRYYAGSYPLLQRPVVRPPYLRPPHPRPPHGRPQPPRATDFNPRQFRGPGNVVRRNYSGRARDIFYGR